MLVKGKRGRGVCVCVCEPAALFTSAERDHSDQIEFCLFFFFVFECICFGDIDALALGRHNLYDYMEVEYSTNISS